MESGLNAYAPLCWIGSAQDWREVLRRFAGLAEQEGFARDGFGDALIQREEEFPTGLPMQVPVAIPHAYPEYVLHPGVGVALLDPPVSFREMGGEEDQWLTVRLVVLMLVTDETAHTDDLSVLIQMFRDPQWYTAFSQATRPQELADCFQSLFEKSQAKLANQS
ncbi:MAG: PTS sugar transporter subunit IIA [Chloroflexi bacterium]|jgi:PTS system galactitol-specific IIA component|nr:PTS sugar transporter subunit IIA [Anaerolineaceae bacterium]NMB90984.1 PTS sugar transporter subunit IIA [Chloroflexota bacterium]